jgi:hypothetical protein
VRVEATVVPAAIAPGGTARIHVEFQPNGTSRAHWNNEAEGLVFWVDSPGAWNVDVRRIVLTNPSPESSDEIRRLEFEVQAPPDADNATIIRAYALYYVCEGVDGPCLYRRHDLSIDLPEIRLP